MAVFIVVIQGLWVHWESIYLSLVASVLIIISGILIFTVSSTKTESVLLMGASFQATVTSYMITIFGSPINTGTGFRDAIIAIVFCLGLTTFLAFVYRTKKPGQG